MKHVLIGGMGNVLLGDDGVGPYIAQLLTAFYEFEEGVQIVDLGTPALDLIDQISGKDVVILIDSIKADAPAGTVLLYRKADICRNSPCVRMDPHSPALVETLLAADMFSVAPRELLLVGIVGESYQGCELSDAVNASIPRAIARILGELQQLKIPYRIRDNPAEVGIWWTAVKQSGASFLAQS